MPSAPNDSNIQCSTKTNATDLNAFDSVRCTYEAKPKQAQCLVFEPNYEHFTCDIFHCLQRLSGSTEGIMQPHIAIWGSFYYCASLANYDMWRVLEDILEILPIPHVITELLKK